MGAGRQPPQEPPGPSAAAPAPPTDHMQQGVGRPRDSGPRGPPGPVGGLCFTLHYRALWVTQAQGRKLQTNNRVCASADGRRVRASRPQREKGPNVPVWLKRGLEDKQGFLVSEALSEQFPGDLGDLIVPPGAGGEGCSTRSPWRSGSPARLSSKNALDKSPVAPSHGGCAVPQEVPLSFQSGPPGAPRGLRPSCLPGSGQG